MKRLILVLSLVLAACLEMPTPSASATRTPKTTATATATRTPLLTPTARTATVTAWALYVHSKPDVSSAVTGDLVAGDVIRVLSCSGKFCKIEQPFGYVWRGCLSDNPEGLGCQEKGNKP